MPTPKKDAKYWANKKDKRVLLQIINLYEGLISEYKKYIDQGHTHYKKDLEEDSKILAIRREAYENYEELRDQ